MLPERSPNLSSDSDSRLEPVREIQIGAGANPKGEMTQKTVHHRVGIAVLASDMTTEREMRHLMPATIDTYVTRVDHPDGITEEILPHAEKHLESAVRLLRPIRPEVVVWSCTSSGFLKGKSGNAALERRLEDASGATALTPATAIVDSMQATGARRVAVLTPYSHFVNARLEAFLREWDFEVVSMRQMFGERILRDFDLQTTDRKTRFEAYLRGDEPEADLLLISCTGLLTVDVVGQLETRLGKPVLSSNLATAYAIFQYLKEPPVKAIGSRLLSTLAKRPVPLVLERSASKR